MTNKMKDAGFSVVVNVVYLGEETFQRQRDVEGFSYGKPIWFISEQTNEKEAWVWVKNKEESDALEARYQADFYPAPAPMTDEEHEEAMCQDAASRARLKASSWLKP